MSNFQSVRRRLADPRIRNAIRRLHRCGPRPGGMCFAELLDHVGADPAVLDLVLRWQDGWDPEIISALVGRDFPPCPLRVVPRCPL